jgi:hypothetical protein
LSSILPITVTSVRDVRVEISDEQHWRKRSAAREILFRIFDAVGAGVLVVGVDVTVLARGCVAHVRRKVIGQRCPRNTNRVTVRSGSRKVPVNSIGRLADAENECFFIEIKELKLVVCNGKVRQNEIFIEFGIC